MSADPIVYCLEKLTDYAQFERLSHEIMALEGYPSIEPLGGFSDKGRDAVHVNRLDGVITLFCYSVREDWLNKLKQDANVIYKHKHPCHRLVYLSTYDYSATERDKAIKFIKEIYGWELDPFGMERLRLLFAARHRHLIGRHSQIFTPAFFLYAPGTELDSGECDLLFVSYAPVDQSLALWLSRRLLAEGYRIWCEGLSLLGGVKKAEVIEQTIRARTFRLLALYSSASLSAPDIVLQRSLAHSIAAERGTEFLIPIAVEPLDESALDWKTRGLSFIPFDQGWAEGLRQLLRKLLASDCPRPIDDGRGVAAGSVRSQDVLIDTPEQVYSSCLPVGPLPAAMFRFCAAKALSDDEIKDLQKRWAFHTVDESRFLSFHHPPRPKAQALGLAQKGTFDFKYLDTIDGCRSANLVPELIRKSLLVKCGERGLIMSTERKQMYFPRGLVERDRLTFVRPDGSRTWVSSVGERTYWRPEISEPYRYSLSPAFDVRQFPDGSYVVLARIRIYLTDTDDKALSANKIASRRKHLCKGWWNHEWFNRLLAVCQFLAEGSEEIRIGSLSDEQVVVGAVMRHWEVPVGINEAALDSSSLDRDDILQSGDVDEEGAGDEEPTNGG
jgi:TIR domain